MPKPPPRVIDRPYPSGAPYRGDGPLTHSDLRSRMEQLLGRLPAATHMIDRATGQHVWYRRRSEHTPITIIVIDTDPVTFAMTMTLYWKDVNFTYWKRPVAGFPGDDLTIESVPLTPPDGSASLEQLRELCDQMERVREVRP